MTGSNYSNFGFISYSHRDMAAARWLQRRLESFKLPMEIHNDINEKSRYLSPIFRDQTDLNTGVLSDELRRKLAESKFLILICSRHSAQSQWVSDEAKEFVESGRLDNIIPVMLGDGAIDERELFPTYLREYFAKYPDKELLGVNIAEVGKEKALIRVVSRMLDVTFDSLWKRHQRQKRIRISVMTAVAAIACSLAYFFAVPVDVGVAIHVEQSDLPVGEQIVLTVDGGEYAAAVTQDAMFDDIRLPGYKRFSQIDVAVSSQFFDRIDTVITIGYGIRRDIDLYLKRADSFARFNGTVYDDNMQPLSGVTVDVAGVTATTNDNGEFAITLDLAKQKTEQPIRLEREGYDTIERADESPGTDLKFIMHKQR